MPIYFVTYPWWVRLVKRPVEAMARCVSKWADKHARLTPTN